MPPPPFWGCTSLSSDINTIYWVEWASVHQHRWNTLTTYILKEFKFKISQMRLMYLKFLKNKNKTNLISVLPFVKLEAMWGSPASTTAEILFYVNAFFSFLLLSISDACVRWQVIFHCLQHSQIQHVKGQWTTLRTSEAAAFFSQGVSLGHFPPLPLRVFSHPFSRVCGLSPKCRWRTSDWSLAF